VLPFLLITFGLAWGIFVLLIFFTGPIVRIFGEISGHHPLFVLAVYAAAIAAISVVAFSTGASGVRSLLSRLPLWRCSSGWYGFLIFGIPAIFVAGSLVKGSIFSEPFPFEILGATLSAIGFMVVLGPVEEIGWRGLALPLLQRKMAPLWAGLILGLIWGLWHLPTYFLSGTPKIAWSFTPFLLGSVSVSVIMTPTFNRSRGSLLLAALLTVWTNRGRMFDRRAGVTQVIFLPAFNSSERSL
jgi:membrane protease YdiL (CAAX protease family)